MNEWLMWQQTEKNTMNKMNVRKIYKKNNTHAPKWNFKNQKQYGKKSAKCHSVYSIRPKFLNSFMDVCIHSSMASSIQLIWHKYLENKL